MRREDGFRGLPSPETREEVALEGCADRIVIGLLRSLVRQEEGHAAAAEQGRDHMGRLTDAVVQELTALKPLQELSRIVVALPQGALAEITPAARQLIEAVNEEIIEG